jgi:hypothetical protein
MNSKLLSIIRSPVSIINDDPINQLDYLSTFIQTSTFLMGILVCVSLTSVNITEIKKYKSLNTCDPLCKKSNDFSDTMEMICDFNDVTVINKSVDYGLNDHVSVIRERYNVNRELGSYSSFNQAAFKSFKINALDKYNCGGFGIEYRIDNPRVRFQSINTFSNSIIISDYYYCGFFLPNSKVMDYLDYTSSQIETLFVAFSIGPSTYTIMHGIAIVPFLYRYVDTYLSILFTKDEIKYNEFSSVNSISNGVNKISIDGLTLEIDVNGLNFENCTLKIKRNLNEFSYERAVIRQQTPIEKMAVWYTIMISTLGVINLIKIPFSKIANYKDLTIKNEETQSINLK